LRRFLVFLQRKSDTVVQTLPKVYGIHFGVQAGVRVQNLKVRQSWSGVGVYFVEAGVKNFRLRTSLLSITENYLKGYYDAQHNFCVVSILPLAEQDRLKQ